MTTMRTPSWKRSCIAALQSRFGVNLNLTSMPAKRPSEHPHSYHAQVLTWMEQGEACALISDAGTPTLNDPGQPLVAACAKRGILLVPIPGKRGGKGAYRCGQAQVCLVEVMLQPNVSTTCRSFYRVFHRTQRNHHSPRSLWPPDTRISFLRLCSAQDCRASKRLFQTQR